MAQRAVELFPGGPQWPKGGQRLALAAEPPSHYQFSKRLFGLAGLPSPRREFRFSWIVGGVDCSCTLWAGCTNLQADWPLIILAVRPQPGFSYPLFTKKSHPESASVPDFQLHHCIPFASCIATIPPLTPPISSSDRSPRCAHRPGISTPSAHHHVQRFGTRCYLIQGRLTRSRVRPSTKSAEAPLVEAPFLTLWPRSLNVPSLACSRLLIDRGSFEVSRYCRSLRTRPRHP